MTTTAIRHPLAKKRRPGPQKSKTGQDDLDGANQILDLVEAGKMEVCRPELRTSLSATKCRISIEEEKVLADRYHTYGDIAARDKLAMSCHGLAIQMARVACGQERQRLPDLINVAWLGVVRATETFNPNQGVKFSTYAHHWIRAKLQRYKQAQKKQESPPIVGAEMQDGTNGTRYRPMAATISINQKASNVGDDDGDEFGDQLAIDQKTPYEQVSQAKVIAAVRKTVEDSIVELADDLQPKTIEKLKVLVEYRVLADSPKTLNEVGAMVGVSREWVRQMEARLLKLVRKKMDKEWQ